MLKLTVILLSVLCGLASAHGKEYSVTLDPEDKFNVTWSFSETTPESYITFTVRCMTTGWVGLGFSPNGGMTGADIIVAWVLDDGTSQIMDMHATANMAPVKDESQDVKLVSAEEVNGVTTVVFKRKLNTCDKEQDNVIMSSTTRMIYAYKDSDPTDGELDSADYHAGNRGVRSLYLLETKVISTEVPSDALTHDMSIESYAVPAEDTTYYCKFFEMPELATKHHIVSLETIVTEGNEALVHHLLLYGCWGWDKEHLRNSTKKEGKCYDGEMPEFAESCSVLVYAWAVGGGKYYFPEEAGYPIGGPDAAEFYMVEMHYDNPQLLTTWVDSSSVRITYSPTVKQHDVGIMGLGLVYGIAVPPQPDKFKIIGFCDSSCTSQWIPESGIQGFSYGLHSHLLGDAIRVDWFRDGRHIGVFAEDSTYDFNFQETRHFETNKKIMPGDTLKITCTYTDPNRDEITYGGLPSSAEMCLAYIYYYPRQPFSDCNSLPGLVSETDPAYPALGVNASFGQESGAANMGALEGVSVWNEEAVSVLQDAYVKTNHFSQCYDGDYEPYETHFSPIDVKAYEYSDDMKDQEEACKQTEATTKFTSAAVRVTGAFYGLALLILFHISAALRLF